MHDLLLALGRNPWRRWQQVATFALPTVLLGIGVLWTAMTVAFEFGFFHLVMGVAVEDLLADYNVLRGRLWVLVLATVLLGPIVVGAITEAIPAPMAK